jgi:hypothetical protein
MIKMILGFLGSCGNDLFFSVQEMQQRAVKTNEKNGKDFKEVGLGIPRY